MASAVTFRRRIGFLEKGGDIDGIITASEGYLTYASVVGQVAELHAYLLGNPKLHYVVPQIERMNSTVMLCIQEVDTNTKVSKEGKVELRQNHGADNMLSKWAAVKADDPMKMNRRDLIVSLSVNVSKPPLHALWQD